MQDLVAIKLVDSFFVVKYNFLLQFSCAFLSLCYELIVLSLLYYFLVDICQYTISIKIAIVNKVKYISSMYCSSK